MAQSVPEINRERNLLPDNWAPFSALLSEEELLTALQRQIAQLRNHLNPYKSLNPPQRLTGNKIRHIYKHRPMTRPFKTRPCEEQTIQTRR
jgi:hypothetical protein